jgi:hypothetical protein
METATQMVVTYNQTEIETGASPAAEGKPRPRRPVSEARWAANSVNATRSTGPTSAAGKARAALNAVTHGSTSNTIIFLKDELPEEFYAQVHRWALQLGAVTEAEYACIEMAVYNQWKLRRARNASAVAINKVTGGIHLAYYQRQQARLLQLLDQIPHDPRAVFRDLAQMTLGVRRIVQMIEKHAATLAAVGKFDARQRTELVCLFDVEPSDLCSDREVLRLLCDILALEYGQGTLTAAQAAELLADYRPRSMTKEEFQRRIEPHLAGMLTIEEAREYLALAIAKRIEHLTDHEKLLKVREEQEIAQEITLAKSDISDAGSRREQNEGRAEAGYFRCLRGFLALQSARRKFGAGDVDERGQPERPEPAAASSVKEQPAAPAAGAAPAAEVRGEIGPNVTQPAGEAKACSEEALQPDRTGDTEGSVSIALEGAKLTEDPRRVVEHPLRE